MAEVSNTVSELVVYHHKMTHKHVMSPSKPLESLSSIGCRDCMWQYSKGNAAAVVGTIDSAPHYEGADSIMRPKYGCFYYFITIIHCM